MKDNRLGARYDFLRRHGVAPGWRARRLREIARIVGGGTPKRQESLYWAGGDIAWATPSDVTATQGRYISKTAQRITKVGLERSSAVLLPAGSVLYSSRATIGAVAIAGVPMATNQGFANFTPEHVESEYLFYLLHSLRPAITRLAAGTTFAEVSKRDLREVWCALPKSGADRLAAVRFMDAVEAVLAKLTSAGEHARSLREALLQKLLSEGTRGEARKKSQIGMIPRSWNVQPVSSAVSSFQYGLSTPMFKKGRLPILRMGNIQHGGVDLDDLKYVSIPEQQAAPYVVRRGDVLFNRTNSQEWVGKTGIYRHDTEAVFASYLIRLIPDESVIDRFYLGHVLNSYSSQCRIKRYATPGVQQVNVNATNLGKVLIPVPPGEEGLREQREIAAVLELSTKVIDLYTHAADVQRRIRESLVLDTFTGRVPHVRQLAAGVL